MPPHVKKTHDDPEQEFPALRQFFSAYLHQEFSDEYGSPEKAAEAYCHDASDQEVAALRTEWDAWSVRLANSSLHQIQGAVRKAGAAWLPQSREELHRVRTALNEQPR